LRLEPVIVQGEPDLPCGSYVLRIAVAHPTTITFGRFQGGRAIEVPAGNYAYVGSAMGQRGATTLAARLARHATRNNDQPHTIRDDILVALNGRTPQQKTLFWNVDYLLNAPSATLQQVFVFRSRERHEHTIAAWLAAQPHTLIVAKGLGANDAPGATHVWRVLADEAWWTALPTALVRQLVGN
jgi:Uri superfamily endonuclease